VPAQPFLGQSAESSSTGVSAQPPAFSSDHLSALSSDRAAGEQDLVAQMQQMQQMQQEQEKREQELVAKMEQMQQEQEKREQEREQELKKLKEDLAAMKLDAHGTVSQLHKTLNNF